MPRVVLTESGASRVVATARTFTKTRVDGLSLNSEARLTKRARNVGPRVLSNKDGALVTERVRGTHPIAWDDDTLAAVATSLATLHRVKLPATERALAGGADLASTLAEAGAALRAVRALLTDVDVRAVRARLRAASARVRALYDVDDADCARLCHGDVRAPNVVVHPRGGRVTLLDFGLAGRGDPAIDVARFFAYEELSAHQRFVVADAYGVDDVVDRALAIFPVMPLCLALSALRYAMYAANGRVVVRDPRAARARIAPLRKRVAALARAVAAHHRGDPVDGVARGRGGHHDDATATRGRSADDATHPRNGVDRTVLAAAAPSIPRVPNLAGSRIGRDDLVLAADDEDRLRARRSLIVEKLDGVALAFFLDGDDVDVRMKGEWRNALGGAVLRSARRWARVYNDALATLLAPGRVLLAEWLWHRLVVRYDALPAAVVFHSVVVDSVLRPRRESNRAFLGAGLACARPLFDGVVGARAWSSFLPNRSAFGSTKPEGIIVESEGRWAKWVAPHYRQPAPRDLDGSHNVVVP